MLKRRWPMHIIVDCQLRLHKDGAETSPWLWPWQLLL